MEVDDVLQHYGIPGMRWGHRKSIQTDGSPNLPLLPKLKDQKRIEKTAKKDAQRHVDAKMAYGKGAGTRRKLLKAELDQKMKDPTYKKSFDDALELVDHSKSINRAKRWRAKEDTKDQAVRSTKIAAKALTGTTSVAAAGILYLRYKPQVDALVKQVVKNM